MQLTGKEIIERGIILGVENENSIQQQGVDMSVKSIREVVMGIGSIPAEGKTRKLNTQEMSTFTDEDGEYYMLYGGKYYEVEFNEGCDMGNRHAMTFKTRSSLVRCGAIVHSGQFDAGFKTDNCGCFLHLVGFPLKLYKNARVAQAIVTETHAVDNLYNGQWQGDNQRKL